LEIRYTATTFIDSEKTHFRFRLRGSDTVWREADTRRVAYFTNLRPGKYDFVVEARNHHGYWSDHPAHFQFVVTPYFHQTWLFYLISGCLIAALLGTLHVRRLSARSRRLQLHQERALITERDRISRDLHDDLGSSLTGIALGIEVTRQKLKEPEELESRLASAAEALRQLVTRLRDVVWSLNPRCDTLDSFCAFLTDYAETFLPQAGLQCRWELPDEIPHLALSAEARYHLLLITKEALTNVVKHAHATEVRVSLSIDRNQITLSVADNGRGFPDASAGAFGNGLRNMSQRAIALHGSCTLTPVAGGGTKVTLHFPRPKPSTPLAL
jgi:signal transduction histidine kinase